MASAIRRFAPTALLFCLIVLLLSLDVAAVGVRLSHAHAPDAQHYRRHSEKGVFPFLTWIRDSAVELIFGRPSASSSSSKSTPIRGNGALNPRYAQETVIRFNVSTVEEENALADASDRLFLDVWAFTRNYVDIRLHKNDVAPLLSLLPKSLHSSFSTLVSDLSSAVWATYPSSRSSQRKFDIDTQFQSRKGLGLSVIRPMEDFDNVFFHEYQPLSVIYRWMGLIESMFPNIVKLETIGKSFEGRDILALRVGKPQTTVDVGKGGDEVPSTKIVVINGGLHAREWIASATVNYIAWSLISSYEKEPLITRYLNNFATVFVPVLNPDGYEYTWNGDRLWRKSRQDTPLNFCRGLDLDHAFGFEWDKNLPEPCSESYGGEQPFQAVEAQQLSEWARNQTKGNASFIGFLDLHSYSQEVLYPYSYSCDSEPPNLENLEELAAGLAKAIRLSSGEVYDVFPACQGAVTASSKGGHGGRPVHRIESGGGSAIDWFYHELHAKYSYQIKLRDRGSYGFLLPSEEIRPTAEEIFRAFKYYADFILGNNGIEKSISDHLSSSSSSASDVAVDETSEDVTDISEFGEWTELKKRRRK